MQNLPLQTEYGHDSVCVVWYFRTHIWLDRCVSM